MRATPSVPRWFVGPVGFAYPEWRGTFYPARLPDADRLAFVASRFNAVEINTTFYAPPSPETVRRWRDATPDAFRFSVKMPRDVTHGPTPAGSIAAHAPPDGNLARVEARDLAAGFLDSLVPLGPRLGAILLQFPPGFAPARHLELLEFLDAVFPVSRRTSGLAIAVELRHSAWFDPAHRDAVLAAFSERGITWSAADEALMSQVSRAPARGGPPLHPSSNALYLRLLGKHKQFADLTREQVDPTERLAWWNARFRAAIPVRSAIDAVYIFVNNDYTGHAPTTARRIMTALGLAAPGSEPGIQREPTLFDGIR